MSGEVWRGECVEVMARMEAGSVDAVVCDPPYGLEFMGREWDTFKTGRAVRHASGGELHNPDDRRGKGGAGPIYVKRPAKRCANCGRQAWSGSPCGCEVPRWELDNSPLAYQAWCERWAREALRVLKPGGYLLAFGGTRTYHRLACAVEDAGFEIRDRILVNGVEEPHPTEVAWGYGSGFPKSLDVSKAIDKAAGVEREVVGRSPTFREATRENGTEGFRDRRTSGDLTTAATGAARRWQGWGTALKPAHEPIVVARKPLSERNVAANVLVHGAGALNIDGARIGYTSPEDQASAIPQGRATAKSGALAGGLENERERSEFGADNTKGRWPANVVLLHAEGCERVGTKRVKGITGGTGNHDGTVYGARTRRGEPVRDYAGEDGVEEVEEWVCIPGCPVAALDAQTVGTRAARPSRTGSAFGATGAFPIQNDEPLAYEDSGGASRFFYCAKASRAEREAGLLGKVPCAKCGGLDTFDHAAPTDADPERRANCIRNDHPTVKPIAVMRWLLRLVTPPGGVVLDPFAGSGTTLCAGELEGFAIVGIEQDERNSMIAEARTPHWSGVAERERREAEQRGVQLVLGADA